MEIHLKIIGIILILLALLHGIFPRYFNWRQELKSVSLVNRQMMYIHAFFIALTVMLMGIVSILYSKDLTESSFGRIICLGFGIFWSARLFLQFFGYSPSLWRGKRFETFIHIFFSALWLYLSFVFLFIYFII